MNAEPTAMPPAILSDQEIEERVRCYLACTGHRVLRSLTVEVQDSVVRIRGLVPSFHLRQLALACQRVVEGIERVVDEIETYDGLRVDLCDDSRSGG
jgi:osmotically-inducible protein OsmY